MESRFPVCHHVQMVFPWLYLLLYYLVHELIVFLISWDNRKPSWAVQDSISHPIRPKILQLLEIPCSKDMNLILKHQLQSPFHSGHLCLQRRGMRTSFKRLSVKKSKIVRSMFKGWIWSRTRCLTMSRTTAILLKVHGTPPLLTVNGILVKKVKEFTKENQTKIVCWWILVYMRMWVFEIGIPSEIPNAGNRRQCTGNLGNRNAVRRYAGWLFCQSRRSFSCGFLFVIGCTQVPGKMIVAGGFHLETLCRWILNWHLLLFKQIWYMVLTWCALLSLCANHTKA